MIRLIVFSIIALVFAGRAECKKPSKTNIAGGYNDREGVFAEVVVFHVTGTLTKVYVRYEPYGLQNRSVFNSGRDNRYMKLIYELFNSFEDPQPFEKEDVDITGSYNGILSATFNLNLEFPGVFLLKLSLFDQSVSNVPVATRFVEIDKSDDRGRQFFLLTSDKGVPLFNNFTGIGEPFKLTYFDTTVTRITARFYNREFPLALPPFLTGRNEPYTFKPDSIFEFGLKNGESGSIKFQTPGIYHFQTDYDDPHGCTVFIFDNIFFPEVKTPEMALKPLRYLTTKKEYGKMVSSGNPKAALDNFWMERASGDTERARGLIKKYYTRVQLANRFFTSYHEGWKTDRGMIYIIYGPPPVVYRNDTEEKWIYGKEGNPQSVEFFFLKVDNPFTTNDYLLDRQSVYKESWYTAVDVWKK